MKCLVVLLLVSLGGGRYVIVNGDVGVPELPPGDTVKLLPDSLPLGDTVRFRGEVRGVDSEGYVLSRCQGGAP